MTLWNIIRDFFVVYIFGGTASDKMAYVDNMVGSLMDKDINLDYGSTFSFFVPVGNNINSAEIDMTNGYITLGDWLSTTATIITLCAICVFLFFFVRWLFRLTAGLISGRG